MNQPCLMKGSARPRRIPNSLIANSDVANRQEHPQPSHQRIQLVLDTLQSHRHPKGPLFRDPPFSPILLLPHWPKPVHHWDSNETWNQQSLPPYPPQWAHKVHEKLIQEKETSHETEHRQLHHKAAIRTPSPLFPFTRPHKVYPEHARLRCSTSWCMVFLKYVKIITVVTLATSSGGYTPLSTESGLRVWGGETRVWGHVNKEKQKCKGEDTFLWMLHWISLIDLLNLSESGFLVSVTLGHFPNGQPTTVWIWHLGALLWMFHWISLVTMLNLSEPWSAWMLVLGTLLVSDL